MTDDEINKLWMNRESFHGGDLMSQLRDLVRAALKLQAAPQGKPVQGMKDEQAAFEAWLTNDSTLPVGRDAHGYTDMTTALMWHTWRAAKKSAPAAPAKAECDGGTCGLGGYCDKCPKTAPTSKPLTDGKKSVVWVLTREINQYDQDGEYFVTVFGSPPRHSQLSAHGVPTERLRHVQNGGGRVDNEYEWFNLKAHPISRQTFTKENTNG